MPLTKRALADKLAADESWRLSELTLTLFVLDVPECEVNPGQGDIRFFCHLMPEIFLGVSCHDEQASVKQRFCKGNRAILRFETKTGAPLPGLRKQ